MTTQPLGGFASTFVAVLSAISMPASRLFKISAKAFIAVISAWPSGVVHCFAASSKAFHDSGVGFAIRGLRLVGVSV